MESSLQLNSFSLYLTRLSMRIPQALIDLLSDTSQQLQSIFIVYQLDLFTVVLIPHLKLVRLSAERLYRVLKVDVFAWLVSSSPIKVIHISQMNQCNSHCFPVFVSRMLRSTWKVRVTAVRETSRSSSFSVSPDVSLCRLLSF